MHAKDIFFLLAAGTSSLGEDIRKIENTLLELASLVIEIWNFYGLLVTMTCAHTNVLFFFFFLPFNGM